MSYVGVVNFVAFRVDYASTMTFAVTPIILYTATVMPYNIFFEVEETKEWKAIDLFATCLFLVCNRQLNPRSPATSQQILAD